MTFKYDPFGRRIEKVSSAGTSIYAYDGNNLIEETDGSGAVVARYSQTENVDEPLAMLRAGATSFYEQDGLGSVTSLTNAAGALAQTYTYDSFGKLTASAGSLTNPFQYTGREFDSETGLYYYRARYYDPSDGRFLSEDPLQFIGGDLDLYSYVWNDPTNLDDPSGRWGFGGVLGASAGAGLGVGAMATSSAGAGVFGGKGGGDCNCSSSGQNSSVTTGGFATGGAFAGVGPHGPRYPDPPGSRSSNSGYVLGYGASVGAGLFGTNAKSVCDLRGPFKTLTIGAGLMLGGEVTIAWSGGTYIVSASVTASPLPVPSAMGSLINTNTSVKPFNGSHCGCSK